jgi:death-on-curing protein
VKAKSGKRKKRRGGPAWLQRDIVLAVHAESIAAHGGSLGVRDEGLLDAALARPQHVHAYEDADLCRLAASYAHELAKNHPFVDGNKRTAFLAAAVFLERNGLVLEAPPAHAVVFVLGLAEGSLPEAAFAAWLRDNTRRPRRPPGSARRTGKRARRR